MVIPISKMLNYILILVIPSINITTDKQYSKILNFLLTIRDQLFFHISSEKFIILFLIRYNGVFRNIEILCLFLKIYTKLMNCAIQVNQFIYSQNSHVKNTLTCNKLSLCSRAHYGKLHYCHGNNLDV